MSCGMHRVIVRTTKIADADLFISLLGNSLDLRSLFLYLLLFSLIYLSTAHVVLYNWAHAELSFKLRYQYLTRNNYGQKVPSLTMLDYSDIFLLHRVHICYYLIVALVYYTFQ